LAGFQEEAFLSELISMTHIYFETETTMTTTTSTTYEHTPGIHHKRHMHFARVSWGAIFAGLAVSLITYLVLSVLGAAIGASALDPMGDRFPFSGFGTGVSIWAAVTTAIAIAAGAFVTGYFSCCEGMIHGVMTWAMTTLVTLWMLFSATSGALNVAAGAAKTGLSVAGQAASAGWQATAPMLGDFAKDKMGFYFDTSDLKVEFDNLMSQTGKPELNPDQLKNEAHMTLKEGQQTAQHAAEHPDQANADLKKWFEKVADRADAKLTQVDHDALVNIIVARTHKSHEEAEKIAHRYEQTYEQARQKFQEAKANAEKMARETGASAAKSVARGSWGALLILIIGAVIGAVMGGIGFHSSCRVHSVETASREHTTMTRQS
jgi:ElaB/YqjD/DUF883 family membrane-anchored ribosome-binding protein